MVDLLLPQQPPKREAHAVPLKVQKEQLQGEVRELLGRKRQVHRVALRKGQLPPFNRHVEATELLGLDAAVPQRPLHAPLQLGRAQSEALSAPPAHEAHP